MADYIEVYKESDGWRWVQRSSDPGGVGVMESARSTSTFTSSSAAVTDAQTNDPSVTDIRVSPDPTLDALNVVKLTAAGNAYHGQTVLADATTAAFNVTLPHVEAGTVVVVKKTDASANAVTVVPGSGTIDGAANHALTAQWSSVRVISDGTNWFVI